MTVDEIKAVLDKFGYVSDRYFRPYKFSQVVLDTPGNLKDSWNLPMYYPDSSVFGKLKTPDAGLMLNFDHEHALLKVKYFYAPQLVSTRFNAKKCSFHDAYVEIPANVSLFGTKLEYPGSIFGSDGRPIRNPQKHDFVFTIDPTTKKLKDYSEIADIEYIDTKAKIYLTTSIRMADRIVCYAFADKFLTSGEMNPEDNSIITYSKPVTDHPFDAIIDYGAVFGFVFI